MKGDDRHLSSYGHTCVVTREGEKKWIADAGKGAHRAISTVPTLGEAVKRLLGSLPDTEDG